ncbi:MAG: SAF domain-containing protein [Coriobacteriaceae bacterium]|nr:SAF domain-containing protein [Coriobacteriaceae bacterium]
MLYGEHIKAQAEQTRIDALERYGGEVVNLLVATRTLEYGDIIDASAVASREWIADLAPDQALVRLEDVIGRQVTVPLAKGLPLTQLNLRDGTSGLDVPAGYVAVSLPLTDKLGLSRNISAGTRVIAFAVSSNSTVLVAGDALVLASPVEATAFSSTQTISLAVLPSDVSALLAASARGDLRLVVPADDVELSYDSVAAAPTEVLAEDGSDPVSSTAKSDTGAESEKAEE